MTQIFYFLGHEQFQPELLIEHAQLAEEVGFDGLCISEHFHPWVSDVGASGFALATLGAIAVKTKKVRLLTSVITPLFRYHPAVVAQAAATIDRLSDGRFMLGLGTGESINETPLGFIFPKYQERSERIREAILIISQLLKGDKLDYSGKYYQTKRAKLYSPPVHSVPIFLAAGGIKSAILAAEVADGVIASVKNPEETMINIIKPALDKGLSQRNNQFTIVTNRWSIFASDKKAAWEALKPWRGLRAPSRNIANDPLDLQKEADSLPKDEILSRYSIAASKDDFLRLYSPLITKLHADIVVIQSTGKDQKNLISFLGKYVLPGLRKLM